MYGHQLPAFISHLRRGLQEIGGKLEVAQQMVNHPKAERKAPKASTGNLVTCCAGDEVGLDGAPILAGDQGDTRILSWAR